MYQLKRLSFPSMFVLLMMVISVDAYALGKINQSDSVFKFQQTLANKGNGFAQYKLGTMYELGVGVTRDIEQAKRWYLEASSKGVKAATDRSVFLTVKEKGFIKKEHQSWVDGIQADAKERKTESMLLLGQLYHQGIGVKKNLDKSLALLTYVNSSGGANVEHEIELIQKEINANKVAGYKSKKIKKHPRAKVLSSKPADLISKEDSEQEKAMTEKRRKYEQVMAQIELEQRKINEQQARVTGNEVVAIDDEF